MKPLAASFKPIRKQGSSKRCTGAGSPQVPDGNIQFLGPDDKSPAILISRYKHVSKAPGYFAEFSRQASTRARRQAPLSAWFILTPTPTPADHDHDRSAHCWDPPWHQSPGRGGRPRSPRDTSLWSCSKCFPKSPQHT